MQINALKTKVKVCKEQTHLLFVVNVWKFLISCWVPWTHC